MICEEKLCRHLDVNTVANTVVVLAEQHFCHRLKLACVQFLKSTQSLEEVMATSGFDHLIESFPAMLRDRS
jgi:speckle-type POZ protein